MSLSFNETQEGLQKFAEKLLTNTDSTTAQAVYNGLLQKHGIRVGKYRNTRKLLLELLNYEIPGHKNWTAWVYDTAAATLQEADRIYLRNALLWRLEELEDLQFEHLNLFKVISKPHPHHERFI